MITKKELARSRSGQIGIALLLTIVLLAILAPFLTTQHPLTQTVNSFQRSSWTHPLGTNHAGQDIWSQLLFGARTSLLTGFMVAGISTALSAVIGASAALIGGIYERIVMLIVDTFIVIPMILMLILLSIYITPNINCIISEYLDFIVFFFIILLSVYLILYIDWIGFIFFLLVLLLAFMLYKILSNVAIISIIISLLCWQGGARIVRAQTLSLKEKPYVSATRKFGAGTGYVLRIHILPEL